MPSSQPCTGRPRAVCGRTPSPPWLQDTSKPITLDNLRVLASRESVTEPPQASVCHACMVLQQACRCMFLGF